MDVMSSSGHAAAQFLKPLIPAPLSNFAGCADANSRMGRNGYATFTRSVDRMG
jgi:hypothetical protein